MISLERKCHEMTYECRSKMKIWKFRDIILIKKCIKRYEDVSRGIKSVKGSRVTSVASIVFKLNSVTERFTEVVTMFTPSFSQEISAYLRIETKINGTNPNT